MIDMKTLEQSINVIKKNGNKKISILQCTSNYPCSHKNLNLSMIAEFKKKFQVPVGFSDHTEGNFASIVATSLGASIIEKHFTLDKKLPGPDHIMSMDPVELKDFIFYIKEINKLLGKTEKKCYLVKLKILKN